MTNKKVGFSFVTNGFLAPKIELLKDWSFDYAGN